MRVVPRELFKMLWFLNDYMHGIVNISLLFRRYREIILMILIHRGLLVTFWEKKPCITSRVVPRVVHSYRMRAVLSLIHIKLSTTLVVQLLEEHSPTIQKVLTLLKISAFCKIQDSNIIETVLAPLIESCTDLYVMSVLRFALSKLSGTSTHRLCAQTKGTFLNMSFVLVVFSSI